MKDLEMEDYPELSEWALGAVRGLFKREAKADLVQKKAV